MTTGRINQVTRRENAFLALRAGRLLLLLLLLLLGDHP